MAYVLLAILALAILASFYAAYMSAQNWPIYQVVLVAFIFLGAVAFFYLGARTLATHQAWRDLVNSRKEEVASLESQLLPLRGGLSPQGQFVAGEIPELEHRLGMLSSVRGGVYYNVSADSVKEDVVQLTLKAAAEKVPDPDAPGEPVPVEPAAAEAAEPFAHGLVPNTVLFAFDGKPISEGGRYLGEFKVVAAPEDSPTVQIAPNLPLTDGQRKQLEAAVGGTWTLYTTMPADSAAVFAGLDDARRGTLLPPESAAEYARADRELWDYQLFFHDNYVHRSLLRDTIARTTTNIRRIEAATNEAVAEATYRDTEKGNLAADLEKFQFELAAVVKYEKSLEQLMAQVRAKLRATYLENRRAATMLTRQQFKAREEIDRRTGAAAPAAR